MTPLMMAALLLGLNLEVRGLASQCGGLATLEPFEEPQALCFQSDVKKLCCPSACAVKKSKGKMGQGDAVLRACMRGLGCSESESRSADVFMRCDCKT